MADAEAEIVISVYREVWNEFYTWETDHCQQIISCLSLEEHPSSGHSEETDKLDWNLADQSFDADNNDRVDDSVSFSVLDIDSRGGHSTRHPRVLSAQTISADYLEEYKTYESCTPASKNITPRPDEQDESSFIAYVTNKEWKEFAHALDGFAWQNEFIDPDGE
jgi:hypothetical protein